MDNIVFAQFIHVTTTAGVAKNPNEVNDAAPYLKNQLKAFIARQVFKNEGFYPILLQVDKTYLKALEIISQKPGTDAGGKG